MTKEATRNIFAKFPSDLIRTFARLKRQYPEFQCNAYIGRFDFEAWFTYVLCFLPILDHLGGD